MIKIWFKLLTENSIVKSKIFTMVDRINEENFFELTRQGCEDFDIPTPLILSVHYQNYLDFNHCVFKPRDFIETFPYDKLILENAIE